MMRPLDDIDPVTQRLEVIRVAKNLMTELDHLIGLANSGADGDWNSVLLTLIETRESLQGVVYGQEGLGDSLST